MEDEMQGNTPTEEYCLINAVNNYELRLYTSDIENIHYEIIDTTNDPPDRDLVYKFQSEAFSEWKTIKKTISSNEINDEIQKLRKKCDKIVAEAKNTQMPLLPQENEEETEA